MGRSVLSGPPDPKSRTLARGERRYRRKVASPKQWAAIIAAKRGPCRSCSWPEGFRRGITIQYHHIVPRSQGGDDVRDNVVPLCVLCHERVTNREPHTLAALAASLTEPERAYVVGKLGEGALERLFGVSAR